MKNIILLSALILLARSSFSAVNKSEFDQVKEALYLAYSELAPSQNEVLKINLPISGMPNGANYWWDIEMIHASYVQVQLDDSSPIEHRIYIMGGFARLDKMTPDGLALTGCHEIAHGIGGSPKKDLNMGYQATTEGQADYYAMKVCLPVVFKYLNELRQINSTSTYLKLCSKQTKYDLNTCLRLFTAMESDKEFFEMSGDEVSFETYSTTVATELNTSPSFYPEVQCRFDTMINGILGLERPQCWFPGGEVNGTLR